MWSVFTNRHTPDHPFLFTDLLALQEKTLAELAPQQASALLFAEVAPTITLGARQMLEMNDRARFDLLKTQVVAGERGGNETWHGPGQWVGFVLTPLQVFTGDSKGVRKAVHQILDHALTVARMYLPEAHIKDGAELGIWSEQGKLASVGIKIKNGYCTSGFALNCIQTSNSFLGIHPCGIADARPDFILKHCTNPEVAAAEFEKLPALLTQSFETRLR